MIGVGAVCVWDEKVVLLVSVSITKALMEQIMRIRVLNARKNIVLKLAFGRMMVVQHLCP